MVKTTDSDGNQVAPFLTKCYEMVEDESTDAIISWTLSNDSFVIWKMTEFSRDLLPKYFKHNNFSSFMRQLNIYGFRKIDTDRWEFANEGFVKGHKHLLKNISRRKYPQSLVQGKSSRQKEKSAEKSEEVEKFSLLWKEVESLKTGKIALTQELVKIEQNQETEQNKLLLLGDRLQGMEKNQQQMLSFLVMAMQNPGVLVQLLQPKENSWRRAETGKRMLEQGTDDCEKVASDGMLVRYQPPIAEPPKPVLKTIPNSDKSPEFEISSDALKDLFLNMDFTTVPMDQKLLSSENHSPVVLPDFLDDSILEQLLLATSMFDNTEDGNTDHEEPADSAMEMDLSVKPLTEEMEKSKILEMGSTGFRTLFEKSQKLEILTEKMGHLASDNVININKHAEEI